MQFVAGMSFLIFSLFCFSTAAEPTPIEFKNEISIAATATQLTLWDILANKEDWSAQRELIQNLSFALPAKTQQISNSELSKWMRFQVVEVRKIFGDYAKWTLPKSILIRRTGYEFTAKGVEAQLIRSWTEKCKDCRFRFVSLSVPPLQKSKNYRSWNLQLPDEVPKGSFSIRLDVENDLGLSERYWISGQLQVSKRVPVAARALELGARLEKSDIKEEWKDISFSTDSFLPMESLVGKAIRRAKKSDDWIQSGDIVREKAVRRGENVKLYVGKGGWEISMQGLADQDGSVGDTINVRNPKTSRVLTGLVRGVREVELIE